MKTSEQQRERKTPVNTWKVANAVVRHPVDGRDVRITPGVRDDVDGWAR